ncbi:hypothetical protein [uncultured Sneathiella sp.]|uniref:hypothetical protein n=1 Tax=uncultured Sneathiella sp. TaxID=879315 RepID=UPI0030EEF9F9|tara:strand:+ start:5687 stop:6298 length:612 start_codon:yes stop_codon:yes gene_type:complete
MRRNFIFILAAFLSLTPIAAGSVTASETAPSRDLVDANAINELKQWLANPVVGISISSQNRKYISVNQQAIDDLDKQWRAERETQDQPLIAATLSSPLSSYLTQIQAASGGLYAEIFIMDANGLNVGQSSITSDFWQGDEAKFQETFSKGVNTVFVDEPEFNEDTKTWRVQVSMTIANDKQQPIGSITVEYNLTELSRRKASA